MHPTRRNLLLTLLTLPAGCAIQPLAQLRTSPVAAPAPQPAWQPPQPGRSWTYSKFNFFNSQLLAVERELVLSVEPHGVVVRRQEVNGQELPNEIHQRWGSLLRDPVWDYPLNFDTAVPLWPERLVVGAAQSIHTHYRQDGGSYRSWIQVHSVVRGWERVQLPVGEFDCLKVERMIRMQHHDPSRLETVRKDLMWLAPEVGRWVARETSGRYTLPEDRFLLDDYLEDHFRWELTGWT